MRVPFTFTQTSTVTVVTTSEPPSSVVRQRFYIGRVPVPARVWGAVLRRSVVRRAA